MHEQEYGNSQRRKHKPEQKRPQKRATDHYSHNAATITMTAMASMASGTM
jgi:hypothetical protein